MCITYIVWNSTKRTHYHSKANYVPSADNSAYFLLPSYVTFCLHFAEIPQILRIPASDEEQMKKYFGKFYRSPQNFHILSGEAQQIKMIGVYLRQKGIASYMKLDELNRAREKRRKECVPEGSSLEQAARSLAERIHTFYYNR